MSEHIIELGDVVEVLRDYSDNVFDAVLCDPPYGLSFMGRKWDYDVPSVALWREVFRVLKPGAPLIAFGGTRTYHRLVVNIEDAGFEIRDQLSYMYGSGFPKSQNAEKAGADVFCQCKHHPSFVRVPGLRDAEDYAARLVQEGEDAGVLSALQRDPSGAGVEGSCAQGTCGVDRSKSGQFCSQDVRERESGVEGWSDSVPETRELLGRQVRQVSDGTACDGQEGRVRDGASAPDSGTSRTPAASDGGGAPHRSQPSQQRVSESGVVAEQSFAQARGTWPTCRRCSKPIADLRGYGTALKPGLEPIVLARKPLEGTLAKNLATWGVGALAIDASRVPYASDADKATMAAGVEAIRERGGVMGNSWANASDLSGANPASDLGRWPANVIMDEAAGALLDAQTGNRPGMSGGGKHKAGYEGGMFGGIDGNDKHARGDNGGASRFYYCAKANRKERDMGCDDLPALTGGQATDREDGSAGVNNPRAGAGRTGGGRNGHPTVKPIALCEYLARLIQPPKPDAILVPFAGSGSEMIGALRAGWPVVVGIERESAYVEIARRRLAAALKAA